ncbi:MAG: Do family serine endopeptidase [Flavobacteriales bacterium]
MKRLASIIIIAFFGGLTAIFAYKYFEKPADNTAWLIHQGREIPAKMASMQVSAPHGAVDLTKAAENSVNAVVHVKTLAGNRRGYQDPFYDFFFGNPYRNQPTKPMATGSGVIISDDGFIVTNNHVINNAEKVYIVLNDNREFEADVIGKDPNTDIALLKVNEKNLPFIYYGNSDDIKVGEWVLAVGNPFSLTSTVTAGIVSAKGRSINILNEKFAIESFIQTDAAVNPGNSGGALVNVDGDLIGINTAIASNTGSYTGYSFAVPVNIVKKVVADLLEFGEVQRAFIGVVIDNVNSELATKKGINTTRGVYVTGLNPGGAAEDAGIKEGDVIISIGNNQINNIPELQEMIGRYRPGDKVDVRVIRNNKEMTIPVVLKNKNGDTRLVRRSEAVAIELGAEFSPVSDKEREKLKINNGIKVTNIRDGKLRAIGIKEGFIITHIGEKPVNSVDDITQSMKNDRKGFLIEGVYPNGTRAYYGLGI